MSGIVKIDGDTFTTDDFIRILKLNGRFETLMDEILKDQLTVRAAKKLGIKITDEELQEKADQFRRAHDLHRAKETNEYFDALGVSLDDFEVFLTDSIYQEKLQSHIVNDNAVEEVFNLNRPSFDKIEVSHILVDDEGAAREIMSILEDAPEMFEELATEHSLADTREQAGYIGSLKRGMMQADIEAKLFSASEGQVLGPFATGGDYMEIFRVGLSNPASLDDDTRSEIKRLIQDQWLAAQAREHTIEIL